MDRVPSILMLAWNRREYFERTINHLLADPSDFRLYIWDNGSADGVSDLIADLRDDRIAAKHFNTQNVGQQQPWYWFVEAAAGEIGGKLDDDIIGEHGWMTRFADMLANEPRFGTLGAWVFLESDWDEEAAQHKISKIGEYRIFMNAWVPGGILLGRLETLRRYTIRNPIVVGLPLDQNSAFRNGLINGYPLPLSTAEHLDDPRSPHCRMNRPGGWDEFAAYSARIRNFPGPEEYGRWIAKDARAVLLTPIEDQLRIRKRGLMQRLKSRLERSRRS